jgi:hypothetical protein
LRFGGLRGFSPRPGLASFLLLRLLHSKVPQRKDQLGCRPLKLHGWVYLLDGLTLPILIMAVLSLRLFSFRNRSSDVFGIDF